MAKLYYSDLIKLPDFQSRFEYLKLTGRVGKDTFGRMRYLNQAFYRSTEYKSLRDRLIIRDNGCDLAVPDYDIPGKIILHHLNPITIEDVIGRSEALLDPENLICVSLETHNAIHYGDANNLPRRGLVERAPNDTCPWKR